MFDLNTSINSLGVVLTFVGVLVIFLNSPLNFSVLDGGSASTHFDAIDRTVIRRNLLMKVGTGLVLLGAAAQLASNYIPPGKGLC